MRVTGKIKQNILGAVMIASLLFLFGTPAHTAAQSLFSAQVPAQVSQSDGAGLNYELGTEFRSTVAGQITSIRFWKDVKETGTHTGHVWSARGKLLATVVFASETASGWQQQALATPLTIVANTSYVVSVNTGSTFYVTTVSGLASKVVNGTLTTVLGKNGLYGAPATFPTYSWYTSNYFRDVVFVAGAGATTGSAAPAIMTQPVSQTITAGQTATFSVQATSTAPITYQWMKNTAAISGATSASYTTPAEAASSNNTQFAVAVTNSTGTTTSTSATLTVNAASVSPTLAPTITTQPLSQTIASGQTATFSVAATGNAPMAYQWKNGANAISGATSSTYTTPAETTSGTFSVIISNSAGTATSNTATLTVTASAVAPTITSQPVSETVTAGQTATFNVAATGTSPLTYQWKQNGTAIGGATSSTYTTPVTTASNSAEQFTVVLTNSAGTATSAPATLTVTGGTLLLNSSASSLSFGNENLSTSATKNVTLTNAGTSTVTISGVTISGAGFTASGVSTGTILTPGQTATLTATFDPSSAGAASGSVTVASNATNSPDSIALSGTGVAVANHFATLTWTASTSTVTGYNMYSSTTSGGPYTKLTATPIAAETYTDSTVQAGLTYFYVVTAVNAAGVESVDSTQISALIP